MRAPKVRLIDEDGKLIGILSSYEALQEAQSRGLDLVEIHNKSDPPVCKIMDYGKWKFDNKKKEKQNKKNQNKILIKEIQMRTRTDEGDIKIKLQKAREFLSQGHKVKINLRFFGREMAHKELGFKLLNKVEQRLADVAEPEQAAKMERRTLFTIVAPLNSTSKKPKASAPLKQADETLKSKAQEEKKQNPETLQAKPQEDKKQNPEAPQAKSQEDKKQNPEAPQAKSQEDKKQNPETLQAKAQEDKKQAQETVKSASLKQ